MNKHDIIEFFDRLAPEWDTDIIREEDIISAILDNAGITEGVIILDARYRSFDSRLSWA